MWLDTVSKSLQVVLGGAVSTNALPWTADYVERATDNSTAFPKTVSGSISNTTPATLVAAPGSGLVRQLLHLSVVNADTVAATVSIRLVDGGSTQTVAQATLAVGDQLYFDVSQGWYALDSSGNSKGLGGGGSSVTFPITPSQGGTGLTTIPAHAVMIGEGTANVALVGPGSSGLPLVGGGAGADPSFAALTVPGGGTGLTTATAHGVLIGNGTSAMSVTGTGTAGQVLTSNGPSADPTFQAAAGGGGTPPCVSDMYNLYILNNTVTPTSKLDLQVGLNGGAWEAIVEDTSSPPLALRARSTSTITIDCGTVGANGIDAGALAASTWYYVWVIAKSDGTTAGLVSTSSSAPTMPVGYTYKALVGAWRTNGSSQLQTQYQRNRFVLIPSTNVFTNQAAGAANTYQSQSIASIVPPTAAGIIGRLGISATTGGSQIVIAADANASGAQMLFVNVSSAQLLDSYANGGNFALTLETAQTVYWKAFGTSAVNRFDISGWSY